MSPTVGSIWASATRTGAPDVQRRSIAAERRRGLRRHAVELDGAWGHAWRSPRLARCGADRLDRRPAGVRCRPRGASGGRARRRPVGLPPAARRGRPTIPTPPATPTPSRRRRTRPPARATSASTGSPRASTPRPRRRKRLSGTATACPTTSSGSSGSPNTSTRSRTAGSAGASRTPTAGEAGGKGKTDIYLKELGGQLFGYAAPDRSQARRRTGCRGACTATSCSTTTTTPSSSPAPSRLADLKVTFAHEYNHILQFGLRRLSGRLVRGGDRGLDGGPGLQRDRRLPALRAPLGTAVRDAADRQLDPGVRLGGLERVAGAPLRALDRPQGLGAGDPHASPAASPSPPTTRRSPPPGARTSAATSPDSPATSPSGATAAASAKGGLYPDIPRQGESAPRRQAAPALPQPHHFPAAARARRAAEAPSSSRGERRAAVAAALALVGRIGSERHGRRRLADCSFRPPRRAR